MPFKRNPINAEKINSLARYLAALQRVMWDNAAHSLLERTLDDSANRRVVLSEAFLAADEILITATRIVRDLRVNESAVKRNMRVYGPFAATERVLMATVKRGADRQKMHEIIREHSLAAWARLQAGHANPLVEAICGDAHVLRFLSADEARALMNAADYVGDAPSRARQVAAQV
jgi:adenylosuccinate lyase